MQTATAQRRRYHHSLAAWKHLPAENLRTRLRCALASRGVDESCVLYVVVVRHPVTWIASMQKQPYGLGLCLQGPFWYLARCSILLDYFHSTMYGPTGPFYDGETRELVVRRMKTRSTSKRMRHTTVTALLHRSPCDRAHFDIICPYPRTGRLPKRRGRVGTARRGFRLRQSHPKGPRRPRPVRFASLRFASLRFASPAVLFFSCRPPDVPFLSSNHASRLSSRPNIPCGARSYEDLVLHPQGELRRVERMLGRRVPKGKLYLSPDQKPSKARGYIERIRSGHATDMHCDYGNRCEDGNRQGWGG